MKIKEWKDLDWENCPCCGGALTVLTDHETCEPQLVYDGDEVKCEDDDCEVENLQACVEEDGHAWVNGDW